MNAPLSASSSLFTAIEMAPRDPILGITDAYNADKNPGKTNLGVGVYYDDNGKVPLLECVKKAEAELAAKLAPRTYLPIDGLATYDKAVQELVFGADSAVVQEKRAITVQALGGTGALKLGADFIKHFSPASTQIWISDPSWENHRALFESAGFPVQTYRYYDAPTNDVNRGGMLEDLNALPSGSIVVLHACCHNPTGVDLNLDDWKNVLEVVKAKGHVPFLDMAYQGFGDGIAEDAFAVRLFAESGLEFFVSSSFSKSFSLYGERVGALSVVTASKDESTRVLSQVKRVIRTTYSNPPTHGATIVATVLNSAELRQMWETELGEMRQRIHGMRKQMVSLLAEYGANRDFSFVGRQVGMFSYSGLTVDQVARLKNDFGIYALDTGRIAVAALNQSNIHVVTKAIVEVL
jgi:aromatic-amino-acid transaminase